MAVDSAISLHGAPGNEHKDGLVSTSKRPAIVVNLNAEVVNDLQRCYQHGGAVQLLGGKSPVCMRDSHKPWCTGKQC